MNYQGACLSPCLWNFLGLHGDPELQNFRNAAYFESYTVILGKMFKNSKLLGYIWNLGEKRKKYEVLGNLSMEAALVPNPRKE